MQIVLMKTTDVQENKDKLEELLCNVLSEEYSYNTSKELAQRYYSNMLSFTKDKSAIILGAYVDDVLVGFMWAYELIFLDERRLHTNFISIDERYRSNGIGSIFIERLSEIAHEKGIRKIEAMCVSDNIDAMRYYKRNGFEIERYKIVKNID